MATNDANYTNLVTTKSRVFSLNNSIVPSITLFRGGSVCIGQWSFGIAVVCGRWCVAEVPARTWIGAGRHVLSDRDILINRFYLTLSHLSPKCIYAGFVNAIVG